MKKVILTILLLIMLLPFVVKASSCDVESITIEQKGKIIWFNIKAKSDASLEDLQNIAGDTLKSFSPENLGYYDLHFLMMREGKKGYFGDKSASSSTINWAKYNLDEDGTNE